MRIRLKLILFLFSLCVCTKQPLLSQSIIGNYPTRGLVNAQGDTILAPICKVLKPENGHFIVGYNESKTGVLTNQGTWLIPIDSGSVEIVGYDTSYFWWRKRFEYGNLYKSDGSQLVAGLVKPRILPLEYIRKKMPNREVFLVLQDTMRRQSVHNLSGIQLIPPHEGFFNFAENEHLIYLVTPQKAGKKYHQLHTFFDAEYKRIELQHSVYKVYFTQVPMRMFVTTDTGACVYHVLDLNTRQFSPTPYYGFRTLKNGFIQAGDQQQKCQILKPDLKLLTEEWFLKFEELAPSEKVDFITMGGTGEPILVHRGGWDKPKVIINDRGEKVHIPERVKMKKERIESDSVSFRLMSFMPDPIIPNWHRLSKPDSIALYPGGDAAFFQLLQNTFECNSVSPIFIQFVVEADGTVTHFQFVDETNPHPCSDKIKAIFKGLPNLIPGTLGGKAVASLYGMIIWPKYKRG